MWAGVSGNAHPPSAPSPDPTPPPFALDALNSPRPAPSASCASPSTRAGPASARVHTLGCIPHHATGTTTTTMGSGERQHNEPDTHPDDHPTTSTQAGGTRGKRSYTSVGETDTGMTSTSGELAEPIPG